MIKFSSRGDFRKTEDFLQKMSRGDIYKSLDRFGQEGVQALASATPKDTSLASTSWYYEVKVTKRSASITWFNGDIENGYPVAIMIQYGHGTGTGGYVKGQDYINPALKPIFNRIADSVWRVVTSA